MKTLRASLLSALLLAAVIAGSWLAVSPSAQTTLLGNIKFSGTTLPRVLTLADQDMSLVGGLGAGYTIARGTITLDGTNPSSATTGLASIVSCALVDKRSTAPGLDPQEFTTITSAVAGQLDVYAWKPTGVADVTLIASTDADDLVDYICIGLK